MTFWVDNIEAPGRSNSGNVALVVGLATAGWLYIFGQALTMDPGASLAAAGPGMQAFALLKSFLPADALTFQPSLFLCTSGSDPWDAANIMKTLAMWAGMLLGMMLPALLPSLQTTSRNAPSPRVFLTGLAGYVVAWSPFCLAGVLLQRTLIKTGDFNAHLVLQNTGLSSGLVMLVMMVHLARPKGWRRESNVFCIGRDPHDRPFRDGLAFGLNCLRCCGPLMLIMFAAGLMNVVAMIGLTGLMILEMAGKHKTVCAMVGLAALLTAFHWLSPNA